MILEGWLIGGGIFAIGNAGYGGDDLRMGKRDIMQLIRHLVPAYKFISNRKTKSFLILVTLKKILQLGVSDENKTLPSGIQGLI